MDEKEKDIKELQEKVNEHIKTTNENLKILVKQSKTFNSNFKNIDKAWVGIDRNFKLTDDKINKIVKIANQNGNRINKKFKFISKFLVTEQLEKNLNILSERITKLEGKE